MPPLQAVRQGQAAVDTKQNSKQTDNKHAADDRKLGGAWPCSAVEAPEEKERRPKKIFKQFP